jgi:hypothetical protein
MIEECADNGRRSAICNWQHCGKKMSISYNGGTTNLIDHLVSTHGFQRTPLKPPKEECTDSGSSSRESYKEPEVKKERKYREKEQTEVFIRSDKDYDYWGPLNIYSLPEPYVTYAGIRDINTDTFFRSFSKVEMKGSEKWIILCLATLNYDLSPGAVVIVPPPPPPPPLIKREKEVVVGSSDPEEALAFLMHMETKYIKKEYLSKLRFIKGSISADLKREANNALDNLPDWISKNDLKKKRKQQLEPEQPLLDTSSTVLKKDPFAEALAESSSGGGGGGKKGGPLEEVEDFHRRKKIKKSQSFTKNGSGSDSHKTSPVSSPMKIPFSTPVPSLITPATTHHISNLTNFNRMKLIVDEKYNKTSFLFKKREYTIAPPEPPQPLENPRND